MTGFEKMYADLRLVTGEQLDELEREGYSAVIEGGTMTAWK